MCCVCKKPPCTRSSATTCFLAVFSEYIDIQECLLKQLFDQPHQLALPFSNKTASFYSLLKIAISLMPEDTVIHVVGKRKKGYFFCFRLWEESCCAIPVPAGLMLAPTWPESPTPVALAFLALPLQPASYLRCRCHIPVPILALEGRVCSHCHN